MPSPFKLYHKSLQGVKFKLTANAQISGADRVYFETRKFKRTPDFFDFSTGQTKFRGKLLREAKCMDIATEEGLLAEVIVWSCSKKPKDPNLEQVKSMHKGSVGLLEGDVLCVIAQSFRNYKPQA